MWKKRYDHYMDDVYFTNELNGQVRELRFAFNTCLDTLYNSVQDFKDRKKNREIVIRLAKDFTNYISTKNDFEISNKLELMLSSSDFNFQIPDEYLSK